MTSYEIGLSRQGSDYDSFASLPKEIRKSLKNAYTIARLRNPAERSSMLFTWFGAISILLSMLALAGMAALPAAVAALGPHDASKTYVIIMCATTVLTGIMAAVSVRWVALMGYPRWCTAFYYATTDRLGKEAKVALGGIAGTTLELTPARRIRDARRWGKVLATRHLTMLTTSSVMFWTVVLWLSWIFHLVHSARPLSQRQAFFGALNDIGWHLAAAVPSLDIPNTVGWSMPTAFASDHVIPLELLAAKLAVFAPLIAAVVALFRRDRFDPRAHPCADSVAHAVVEARIDVERQRMSEQQLWDEAVYLASRGVKQPLSHMYSHLADLAPKEICGV